MAPCKESGASGSRQRVRRKGTKRVSETRSVGHFVRRECRNCPALSLLQVQSKETKEGLSAFGCHGFPLSAPWQFLTSLAIVLPLCYN